MSFHLPCWKRSTDSPTVVAERGAAAERSGCSAPRFWPVHAEMRPLAEPVEA